jgi:hypothetical protein
LSFSAGRSQCLFDASNIDAAVQQFKSYSALQQNLRLQD